MSEKYSELSSFIWKVCDDFLRSKLKEQEYGDVILPFVVLRRLDCVLEPSKDKVIDLFEKYSKKIDDPTQIILNEVGLSFYNHSKYDLQRLKQDHLNITLNFNTYLNGFSPNVREIIENFQLDKVIEKLVKSGIFYKVIETFSSIDLHPDVVDNHTMGLIFEELLRKFSEMSNETSGEHYTPRDIVSLLVSISFSKDKKNLKGDGKVRSIFDCCCGTGGILSLGKKWILENVNPNIEINLFGQETIPQTHSICKSDMLISGENPNNIKLGSSLSDDQFEGVKFDYLLSNPPYGTGKDQRGLEKDVTSFIDGLVKDFSDCKRVLKDEGSLWINFGEAVIDGNYNSIPHRFVHAMVENGWIFNDEIIWIKNNPVFTQAKRTVRSHEYIFHFVKSKGYYYDISWLSNLNDPDNLISLGTSGKIYNLMSTLDFRGNILRTNSNNMDDLRKECKKRGFNLTHSAAFPITVPLISILTTSKPGDTILDIYSGTATTGEAALGTGRKYVGYELKPEYIMGSEVRLRDYLEIAA